MGWNYSHVDHNQLDGPELIIVNTSLKEVQYWLNGKEHQLIVVYLGPILFPSIFNRSIQYSWFYIIIFSFFFRSFFWGLKFFF